MTKLRDVNRVYWVNVREGAPTPEDATAINRAIDDAQDRWPNLRVIDMDEQFQGEPGWVDDDGVHFNARGNAAFAQLIEGELPKVR